MSTPPVPVIDVGRPLDGQLAALDEACRDPGFALADRHNRWPAEPDGFRATMAAFYDAFSELSVTAVEIVHRALGLDPSDGLRFFGDRANSSVRLNHYPVGDPVPEAERSERPRRR